MHNAPSVVYPVGRSRLYAGLLLALGLLALAMLLLVCIPLLWEVRSSTDPVVDPWKRFLSVLGLLLWLAWSGFAAISCWRSQVGELQWDALGSRAGTEGTGVWRWCTTRHRDGTPLQQVRLALDWQSRMLLQLHNTDTTHVWVWVEEARDPQRWRDLRRALVATRA